MSITQETWWERLKVFEELNSTNIYAKEAAKAGAPHGTVIFAEKQTGAYGKLNRIWVSPKGGLWFSVILRPDKNIDGLSLLFALWTIDFFRAQTGLEFEFHWPNDIFLKDKKLGGILLEGVSRADNDFVVAGIGLNINNPSNEIPSEANAVSLCERTGREMNIDYLLEDLLLHLQFNYETYEKYGFKAFLDEILQICPMIGRTVNITTGQTSYNSKVLTIGDRGQLILESSNSEKSELWTCDKIRIV